MAERSEQLKNALELMELPMSGGREELVERLLAADGRVGAAAAVEARWSGKRIETGVEDR